MSHSTILGSRCQSVARRCVVLAVPTWVGDVWIVLVELLEVEAVGLGVLVLVHGESISSMSRLANLIADDLEHILKFIKIFTLLTLSSITNRVPSMYLLNSESSFTLNTISVPSCPTRFA